MICLEPRPDVLIESLRSIGYNFNSAIADIIDNSLSAEASHVSIFYDPFEGFIGILDDGYGMTEEELSDAMRFGSKDPLEMRPEKDLGRFGLGLKSASLSQCKDFIVVSKKNNILNALEWNLDIVRKTSKWTVVSYSKEEINKLPRIQELEKLNSGTYVIWRNFDKIDVTSNNLVDTIERLVDDAKDYLSLVFHQYINNGVVISVNGDHLNKMDPFLTTSSFTQQLKVEPLRIIDDFGNSHIIKVTPYVLPHFNSMTEDEKIMVGGNDSYRNKQGFYIYRNKRLIIWGTWFRIVPNNELYKNARVKVEIPNSLDYIWNVDVKKSSATIPSKIKTKLFHAVNESITSSKNIYQKRARNQNKDLGYNCIWETIKERDKTVYKINRELPILKMIYSKIDDDTLKLLDSVLNDIENNIPKYEIFSQISQGKDDANKIDLTEIKTRMLDYLKYCNVTEEAEASSLLKDLANSEPYCNYDNIVEIVLKDFKDEYR